MIDTAFQQGRFKGRAITPGSPLEGALGMTFICFKQNNLFKIRRDSEQEYTTLYSDVALSIINDFSTSLTYCQL